MLPTCRFTERGPGPEKCPSKAATDSLWILHCGLHSCCPADRRAKGLDE